MNCSITEFGARITDALQTEPIQKAIDACFLAGGGVVRIPEGFYRIGSIRLRSNVTLYLEKGAILEGSHKIEDYDILKNDIIEPVTQEELLRAERISNSSSTNPYSRWCNAIIRAVYAENVSIIGEKYTWIDGQNCYDPEGEDDYRGPHTICMYGCKNVKLKGYSIRRSGNWGNNLFECRDIEADGISVFGGHDAFDIRSCDNVKIENCHFDTGDDDIAGFDNNNVLVRNCHLSSSCFLFRFGGNHVLIENCTSDDNGNFGFRGGLSPEEKQRSWMTDETAVHRTGACFMYYCDFRAKIRKPVEDILIRNCRFGELESIFSHNWDEDYQWCINRPLRQIRFENCSFKSVTDSVYIHGSKEEPMLFEMDSCDITVNPKYKEIPFIDGNVFGTISLKNIQLHGYADPRIVKHSEGTVEMENCSPIKIVEAYDPDFRGTYRDQVLNTEEGAKVLPNCKDGQLDRVQEQIQSIEKNRSDHLHQEPFCPL